MNRFLLAASFAMLVLATGAIQAKEGQIIGGSNGTKWCCPGGKASDGCEKGASSTPLGAKCNFASRAATKPDVLTPRTVQPSAPRRSDTPVIKENPPKPD